MNQRPEAATGAMKITLWGINYAPEAIGIAPFNRDLSESLATHGHEVTVVTTFPYYPQWGKQPGDHGRWHSAESIGGVSVHRCWCYVPAVATALRRIAHELSFGLVSFFRVLALPRSDVYLVVSPPLVLGFFAWIAAALKRSRFVFHVQDLQPDAAVGLGMIRGGLRVRALYALERLAYAKAAAVSGISEGMLAAIRAKGVPTEKCVLLPNWVRPITAPATVREADRRRFEASAGTMLAVYSGNLGRKQNLGILIEAAGLLLAWPQIEGERIKMIIAGDGAARPELEAWLRAYPRPGILCLLPLLNDRDHAALLRAADVALITQAAGTGRFFFPSKLLAALAAGLPVVAVADEDSELARAIRAGGFGAVVAPGEPAELAKLLQQLSRAPQRLADWAGHSIWVRQFSRRAILPRFEQMLRAVGAGRQPVRGEILPPPAESAPVAPAEAPVTR